MAQHLDYTSGPLSPIAVLAAGLLMLGARALYAELNGMYPTAAGIRLWMSRAMNDRLALSITLTYMTAIVLVIAADAFIIGEAIAYAFGNGRVAAIVYVALLLVLATWLNLRGIRLAGRAEQAVTSAWSWRRSRSAPSPSCTTARPRPGRPQAAPRCRR